MSTSHTNNSAMIIFLYQVLRQRHNIWLLLCNMSSYQCDVHICAHKQSDIDVTTATPDQHKPQAEIDQRELLYLLVNALLRKKNHHAQVIPTTPRFRCWSNVYSASMWHRTIRLLNAGPTNMTRASNWTSLYVNTKVAPAAPAPAAPAPVPAPSAGLTNRLDQTNF